MALTYEEAVNQLQDLKAREAARQLELNQWIKKYEDAATEIKRLEKILESAGVA